MIIAAQLEQPRELTPAADLAERTARAVAFAIAPMLADIPVLFASLAPHEIAPHAYAYFRIADYVINDTWRMCVEYHASLDDAARAFADGTLQELIRDRVARMCLESLTGSRGDLEKLGRFSVNQSGRLVSYVWHAPHTSFSSEQRLPWEQDPESNYKGSKAEVELLKLRDRMRRERIPWNRDMCRAMGVTPMRQKAAAR